MYGAISCDKLHIGGVVASYVHLEGGRLWVLAPVGSNQTIKLVFVASLLSTQT